MLIFVPLFYFAFFLLNKGTILLKRHAVLTCLVIVFITTLPLMNSLVNKDIRSSIKDASVVSVNNPYRSNFSQGSHVSALFAFLKNYGMHLSVDFLLTKGDRDLHHNVGKRGQLLWFTFFMSLIGLFTLIFRKEKVLYIFPIWLLLFPVPAALMSDYSPNAARVICGLPAFQILASVGFFSFISSAGSVFKTYKKVFGVALYIALILIVFWGVRDLNNFTQQYFVNHAKDPSKAFDYGSYVISKATKNMKDYTLFVLPFDFTKEIFLYLQDVNPKSWLRNQYTLKYVSKDYEFTMLDVFKNIGRIIPPGTLKNGKPAGFIYDELTAKVMYEIERIDKDSNQLKGLLPANKRGLIGEYFNGISFDKFTTVRVDPKIDFKWTEAKPPHKNVNVSHFSAKWSGWINIQEGGNYKFITKHDDGAVLTIDKKIIVNDWKNQPPLKENIKTVYLSRGWHRIVLKYYNSFGISFITLNWQPPGGEIDSIPLDLLYPSLPDA